VLSLNQTKKALEESDAILFVVDIKEGLSPIDSDIANILRKQKNPVLLVANKCDDKKYISDSHVFARIWRSEIHCVSGAQGTGFSDLLAALRTATGQDIKPSLSMSEEIEDDESFNELCDEDSSAPVDNTVSIAIVGRPNVGKSSLVNQLLREERLSVSAIAGTTRDSIDSVLEYQGQKFVLIDTAGIRRHRSVESDLEKKSVNSSLGSMDHCDVALMIIDAEEGLTEQDLKIASFIQKKSKGAVIVVNKWDKIEVDADVRKAFVAELDRKLQFLSFAPKIFVSALTGSNVFKILKIAQSVAVQCKKRIGTGEINRWLASATGCHEPPVVRGRRIKFYYGAQVYSSPPTFMLKCNEANGVHFSYTRYLINRLRDDFGFEGAPLRIVYREK